MAYSNNLEHSFGLGILNLIIYFRSQLNSNIKRKHYIHINYN